MQNPTAQISEKNNKVSEEAHLFLTSLFQRTQDSNVDLTDLVNKDLKFVEQITAFLVTGNYTKHDSPSFESNSMLFLQILDTIVTHFEHLIGEVLAILRAENIGNYFLDFKFDDHIALYLSILEKIQLRGYTELESLFIKYHKSSDNIADSFTIRIIKFQSETHVHKLFNLLATHFKNVKELSSKLFLFEIETGDFLNELHSAWIRRPQPGKKIFFAYMRFLEGLYILTHIQKILPYLLEGFNIQKAYGFIEQEFTLDSDQLAFELVCSTEIPSRMISTSNANLATTAQKRVVVDYIKKLPENERKLAWENAATQGHPLNIYFHANPIPEITAALTHINLLNNVETNIKNFLTQRNINPKKIISPLVSLSSLDDYANETVRILSIVDETGKNLAFYLERKYFNKYFKLLHALVDKGVCPIAITNLLSIQETQGGETIGHFIHRFYDNYHLFLELLKKLPVDCRIRLLSIRDQHNNFLFTSYSETCRAYLQLLHSDLQANNPQVAAKISINILAVCDNNNQNLGQALTSSQEHSICYLPLLKIINTTVTRFPDLTDLIDDILFQKTENRTSKLNLNNLKSNDQFSLYIIIKFKIYITHIKNWGLKRFIDTRLKASVIQSLDQQFESVIKENHQYVTYVAYLKFLKTLHYSTDSILTPNEREKIVELILSCVELANETRENTDKKIVLDPSFIHQYVISKILKKEARNNNRVKRFLNSLFTSPCDPDEIIDLLQTVDDKGKHLGVYLSSIENQKTGLMSLFQDNHLEAYYRLLHHLLHKGANAKKISHLLTFMSNDNSSPLIDNLQEDAVNKIFLELVTDLPVNSRLDIFLIESTRSSLAASACDNNDFLLKRLDLLHADLSSSDVQTAARILQVLAISKTEPLGIKITNDVFYNTSSLLFLKIIDFTVTYFPNLIPDVSNILLDLGTQKSTTFGNNLLRLESDIHIRLFLTILEKIQSQGYAQQVSQILLLRPTGGAHELENSFLARATRTPNLENEIKLINLITANIKSPDSSVINDLSLILDVSISLRTETFLPYMYLLEAMYTVNRNLDTLHKLSWLFSQQKNYGFAKQNLTLDSDQLAYEIASTNESEQFRKIFSTTEQKQKVIIFIANLPTEERIRAANNIKTLLNPLNLYLDYPKDTHVHQQVNHLVALNNLDQIISEFLSLDITTNSDNLSRIALSLRAIVTNDPATNIVLNPDIIVELLSTVNTKQQHLAFYLKPSSDNQAISIYFRLLSSLLYRGTDNIKIKIARLLSIQEQENKQTIGHLLSNHTLFFELVKKLSAEQRIHLLSIKNKSEIALLIVRHHEITHEYLNLLHSDLKTNNMQTAKDIFAIFSTSDSDENNVGLTFISNCNTCALTFLEMIDYTVTTFPKLISQVLKVLLNDKDYFFYHTLQKLKSNVHSSRFRTIIDKIQMEGHSDLANKLLPPFNCKETTSIAPLTDFYADRIHLPAEDTRLTNNSGPEL